MAGLCEQLENWNSFTADKRFHDTEQNLRDLARRLGINDNFQIKREAPPHNPGHRAEWDGNTDTLYLDPDLFENHPGSTTDGFDYAYSSASHELMHGLHDQLDEEFDPDTDAEWETSKEEREQMAQAFAAAFLKAVKDQCKGKGKIGESPIQDVLNQFGADALEREVESSDPPLPSDWSLPEEE
ncbi:MAG TPA: hypothetical protein VGL11_02850 [Candidatus Binatia bacterium]|jgi:hypothetical protein